MSLLFTSHLFVAGGNCTLWQHLAVHQRQRLQFGGTRLSGQQHIANNVRGSISEAAASLGSSTSLATSASATPVISLHCCTLVHACTWCTVSPMSASQPGLCQEFDHSTPPFFSGGWEGNAVIFGGGSCPSSFWGRHRSQTPPPAQWL